MGVRITESEPHASPQTGVIRGRRRWPYTSIAAARSPITAETQTTVEHRPTARSGPLVASRRFIYTPAAMPLLPQPGEIAFNPGTDGLGFQAIYPSQHFVPKRARHLLLRSRPDTPWDLDIAPPLWQATYPDFHWRKPRDTRPFSANGFITPEPDSAPVHWLPTYPAFHYPRTSIRTAQQEAYRDFLDTPASFPPGAVPWFMPLAVPPSLHRAASRLHLDAATFDRDLTQGGDPSPSIEGDIWRRRNMVSPRGMLVRPILPGSN